MKKINIGPTKASDYFGVHVIPANTRFLKISNQENAFSLAQALWDTTGWLWSDRYPGVDRRSQPTDAKAFDDDLFKRCPDLRYIRDLAEAAKHGGELGRSSVLVTGISGSGSPGGTTFTSTPFGTLESTPECTLRIDVPGGSRDMKEVLAAVFSFLQAETS